jgi:hypothetical protein
MEGRKGRTARQRAYVSSAARRSAEARARRVERIEGRWDGFEGLAHLLLPQHTMNRGGFMYLRSALVAGPIPTYESIPALPGLSSSDPPPASALVANRGEALAFYITCVYVHHRHQRDPADVPAPAEIPLTTSTRSGFSWARLLGFGDLSRRNQQLRLHRALTALATYGLVQLGPRGSRGRFERFVLLDERRNGVPYTTPTSKWASANVRRPGGSIGVIPNLVRRGWVATLTAAELLTYLALLHKGLETVSKPGKQYFFLMRDERLLRYGLSDEAYSSHRELNEFGLLDTRDNGAPRNRGRVSPAAVSAGTARPYLFRIANPPRQSAHLIVHQRLVESDVAPHLGGVPSAV